MDRRDVYLHVKSTLDKLIGDYAEELSNAPGASQVLSFDLDDHDSVRAMQASNEQALVHQILTMDPDPAHPLYAIQFLVGAKTSQDPGNYQQAFLLTELHSRFDLGTTFNIADWSQEDEPTEETGTVYVTACSPSPQSFENSASIRVLQITAKVM